VTSWDGHAPAQNDPVSRHAGNGPATWPHRHDQASSARGRRGTNRGRNLTLAVVAVLVLAGLAGFGYKLAHRQHGAAPPAAAQTGPAVGQQNPAKVVYMYFYDINQHRFQAAWKLTGQNGSLSAFKKGFAGTKHDVVTIIKVNGNVVTAALKAQQIDGTVKLYGGTYTVINGIISSSNVHLLSESKPVTS